jgi:hypothetical protein
VFTSRNIRSALLTQRPVCQARKRCLKRALANITPSFAVALCPVSCFSGVIPMGSDLESDEVLSAAISGIPKVAELIALMPAEDQSRALEAAEKSYLQTAFSLGYEGAQAHEWAAAIMVRLRSHNWPAPPIASE